MAAIHLPPGNRARRRWCGAERRCASGASFPGIGFRRDEPGLHARSSPHRVHVEDRQAGGQQRTQCAGIEGYHDRMRVHGFDGAPFRSCSLDSISAHPPRPCRRGSGSTHHDADRHHLARHCRSNCPAGTPHRARFAVEIETDWPIPRGHRARPGSRAPLRSGPLCSLAGIAQRKSSDLVGRRRGFDSLTRLHGKKAIDRQIDQTSIRKDRAAFRADGCPVGNPALTGTPGTLRTV
jgi:hypothetical protein